MVKPSTTEVFEKVKKQGGKVLAQYGNAPSSSVETTATKGQTEGPETAVVKDQQAAVKKSPQIAVIQGDAGPKQGLHSKTTPSEAAVTKETVQPNESIKVHRP